MPSVTEAVDRPRVATPLIFRYGAVRPPSTPDPGSPVRPIAPARFSEQLTWLAVRGLRGVSVGELLTAMAHGAAHGLVGLTFDGGTVDFATYAAPRLDAAGFTATVFVISAGRDWPGGPAAAGAAAGGTAGTGSAGPLEGPAGGPRRPLLGARQIVDLHRRGYEIGCSGSSHHQPGQPGRLTLAATTAELVERREALEHLIGERVQGLSYAGADIDDVVTQAAAAAGYRYACLPRRSRRSTQFALSRVPIGRRDPRLRLAMKVGWHRPLR